MTESIELFHELKARVAEVLSNGAAD